MNRMLKIATVDDMQEVREHLAGKIESYMDSRWLKYELLAYKSGEAFVVALEKERFDIVFMDIFMDGMTGIDAAAKLRAIDMDCKLVFLTSSKEFLEEGYGYNPSHYLFKPFVDSKFEEAMHNCQIKRQIDVSHLDVMVGGVTSRIDTTEIIYIDTCKRNVFVHLTTGILSVGRGFGGISELVLSDSRFIQCIKGVLVNMDFIATIDENVFVLKNGERLQMTIRNKNNLI